MNEEQYQLFDKYLQKEMIVNEKIAFEKQLEEDKEFALAFETFKELNVFLNVKFGNREGLDSFKENINTIGKEHFRALKPKVIAFKPWYYVAAASVVLLFGVFFLMQNSNPVFEDYNQYEQAYFTERGDVNAELIEAQDAFNSKNYKEAALHFEVVLKEKASPELEYFYGVSLLEENRIKEADSVFTNLKSGTSIYKNKAIYNLALSKLKHKDYKSCKEILLKIPVDYEDYDNVKKLIQKLD